MKITSVDSFSSKRFSLGCFFCSIKKKKIAGKLSKLHVVRMSFTALNARTNLSKISNVKPVTQKVK